MPITPDKVLRAEDVDRTSAADRAWVHEAVRRVEADGNRSADTHLVRVPLGSFPDVDLYLKDESTHPTGSLKHRLARSLVLYALCNGQIHEGTTIIEASSGSTAISEAYFARLLELAARAAPPLSACGMPALAVLVVLAWRGDRSPFR